MGSDFYETPHLDQLAGEGMIFTNAYSASANCAPARASLLSGQYSPRHQIYNVGTSRRGEPQFGKLMHVPGTDTLDRGIKTWAKQIQQNGYRTAIMGKWHLSQDPRPYGFHINIAGSHSGSPPRGYFPTPERSRFRQCCKDEYLTDRLTQEAVTFIEENSSRPWLLYLSHFAVHTPLQGRPDLVEKYNHKPKGSLHDHAVMAAMIESVDQGIGKLSKRWTGRSNGTTQSLFSAPTTAAMVRQPPCTHTRDTKERITRVVSVNHYFSHGRESLNQELRIPLPLSISICTQPDAKSQVRPCRVIKSSME